MTLRQRDDLAPESAESADNGKQKRNRKSYKSFSPKGRVTLECNRACPRRECPGDEMHLRNAVALLIGAMLLTSSSPSSQAQRSNSDRSERWELLGEKKVGLWLDRDVIKLDQDEDWYKERRYRQIRFDVKDNDIHLNRVRLVYFNGYDEDLRVDRLIRDGDQYVLRLDGERGYVRRMELSYRSRLNFEGRATVKIYGERAGSRDGDRVAARDEIDDRDRDRVVKDRVEDF